MENVNGSPELI